MGIGRMGLILTTIPLISLIRHDALCVSCNKRIKIDRQTFYESGGKYDIFLVKMLNVLKVMYMIINVPNVVLIEIIICQIYTILPTQSRSL
jgi:hypothetical protein